MIQREINDILIKVYNNDETDNALKNYQEGYFKYKINNEFNFISADPNNKYRLVEKAYVPTYFSDHVGKLQPSIAAYDEETTFTVSFAIADEKRAGFDFKARFLEIEQFVIDTIKLTGAFESNGTTYNYIINSSPLVQDRESVVINGIRSYFVNITYVYRVSDVPLGDSDSYAFRLYNTEDTPYTLDDISRSSSYGTVSNPFNGVNDDFTTNTPGPLVYKLNLNIYDDTNPFTTTLRQIWARQLKQTETYFDLTETVSGLVTTRIVFIQNLQPINPKGLPKQWAFTVIEASPSALQ